MREILEAYDLAGALRGAATLAGCNDKTVAHWVAVRDRAGGITAARRRRPAVEGFAGKIDELVERSHGKIRADVAHQKLVAIGYLGSERRTRRWVAEAKRRWRQQHGRRTRSWIPEPGLWMQWGQFRSSIPTQAPSGNSPRRLPQIGSAQVCIRARQCGRPCPRAERQ